MRRLLGGLKKEVFVLLLGGCLLQNGCANFLQREWEVLLRPQSSPTLINQSFLVKVFGPQVLQFW
jgi:hypothetical protein